MVTSRTCFLVTIVFAGFAACLCRIVTPTTSESVTEESYTGEESTVECVASEGSVEVPTTEAASTEEAVGESTEEASSTEEGIGESTGGALAVSTEEEAGEAFSCEGKEDGTYDLGCSSTFCTCLDGAPTYLHCPAGLKYDSISRRCLDPDYVVACGGTTPSGGAGETSTEAAITEEITAEASTAEESPAAEEITSEAPELEVTKMTEEAQPESTQESPELSTAEIKTTEEILEAFSCEGKPDGLYDLGCSSTFCSCLGGQPTFMHCPAGLKYDIKSSRCLPGADVAACGSTATEPSATFAELETTKDQADVEISTEEATTLCQEVEASTEAAASEEASTEEAVSEEVSTEAVSKETSTEAAASEEASTEEAVSEEASTEAVSEEGSTEAVSEGTSTEAVSEETSTEAVSEEASTEAVSEEASTEEAVSEEVSTEAVSEETSTETVSEEASTGAVSEEASTEVVSEELASTEASEEVFSEEAATTGEVSLPAFSCDGRLDGVYGLGCSGMFCSCLDGAATCLSCPSGLKYDEISERCLDADYVAACGGTSSESVTASGSPTEQSVSVEQATEGVSEERTTEGASEATEEQTLATEGKPTEAAASEAPSIQKVFSTTVVPKGHPCYGLRHGVYCDGCSSKYLVCLKQFKGWHQCPWPLKYDVSRYRCALPKTVQACLPVYQAAPSGPTVPDAGAP